MYVITLLHPLHYETLYSKEKMRLLESATLWYHPENVPGFLSLNPLPQ
jgi:hypothetical protein